LGFTLAYYTVECCKYGSNSLQVLKSIKFRRKVRNAKEKAAPKMNLIRYNQKVRKMKAEAEGVREQNAQKQKGVEQAESNRRLQNLY
jgi:hypothetical protein